LEKCILPITAMATFLFLAQSVETWPSMVVTIIFTAFPLAHFLIPGQIATNLASLIATNQVQ
jgi:hypothetical protein